MADEPAAPEETPDTPQAELPVEEATSAPDQGTPEHDWEKRYNDLRPEYDRTTQEAAEYRQFLEQLDSDPEVQEQVLRHLAQELDFEFEDTEVEDGEEDPLEDIRENLGHLMSAEQQREAQGQAEQLERQIESEIDQLAQSENREFTDNEKELLLDAVVTAMLANNQPADVQAAYERLTGAEKSWQERYLKSKRVSTPAIGQEGSETLPLDATPAQRQADMVAKLRANEAQ